MTRFLLVFTLLTLAVPTTTEPAAQSSGTTPAPDPNGPQPIGTTTESDPLLLEPVDSGNDTREMNQPSQSSGSIIAPDPEGPQPIPTSADPLLLEPIGSGNGTTEANATDSPAPDPNGPQPIETTTESVPDLLEAVGPSNDTREANQTSLGTTEATVTDPGDPVPSWVLPDNGEMLESNRTDLTPCSDKSIRIICFIGSNCREGMQGNHRQITSISARKYRSSRKASDSCDVAATLTRTYWAGRYDLEYHTTKESLNLPIVIKCQYADRRITIEKGGGLVCNPSCRVEHLNTNSGPNGYFWTGTVVFRTVDKHADLTQCYKREPSSICFVGNGCLSGKNPEHDHISWLSKEIKANFTYERAAGVGCNVAAVLIALKPATYSLAYHTTRVNRHLFFTRYTHGPPRVERVIYIKEGPPSALKCHPACEFTRTEGESDENYWSGEIFFRNMSAAEVEEHERNKRENPIPLEEDDEWEKREPTTNLSLILGVCAAILVVSIAGVVIVIKVIQRGQEKDNKKRTAAIDATAAKNNDLSRKGPVKATEVEPLIDTPPPQIVGPPSDPVSESAKNKEGEF